MSVSTVVVVDEGHATLIRVGPEWPIVEVDGERMSIDDLAYDGQPTNMQDAFEAVVDACANRRNAG